MEPIKTLESTHQNGCDCMACESIYINGKEK